MAARIALIRAATIDDAAEIARLSAQLGYPADVAVLADRLERLLPLRTHAVLVCEGENGRLVGFIGLERRLMVEAGDKAEVVGLVVDRVSDILTIRSEQIQPVPEVTTSFDKVYAEGIIAHENGMICFLNLARMFKERDMEDMAA